MFWCLDKKGRDGKPVKSQLFGSDAGRPHRRIDVTFQPCNPVTYKKDIELKKGQCFVKNRNDKNEMAKKLENTLNWLG